MRHTTERHLKSCGCRTVGECDHNLAAEMVAIHQCVNEFAEALKAKLTSKLLRDHKSGWDDPDWPPEVIIKTLTDHVEKGDMVDVAAFAMFAWNQEGGD